MRILHFSDIHLRQAWREVPWRDWPFKRMVGGMNLLSGRAASFAGAEKKLRALDRFRQSQAIDLVLFTGDYTAMGTEHEFALAKQTVGPLMTAPLGYLNVPGNHDLYVWDVIKERRFHRHFGETLKTDFPEYSSAADTAWPWVRLMGDRLAVVGINSARPNPQPWRSSGKIPADQLELLTRILADRRINDRFVFVMTHYAPCLAQGQPDLWHHGLVNAAQFLSVCRSIRQGAILCGHVHHRFLVRLPELDAPIICAGSAVMEGREAVWVYEVEAAGVRAIPGRWNQDHYLLDEKESVRIG